MINLQDLTFPHYGITVTSLAINIDSLGIQTANIEANLSYSNNSDQLITDMRLLESIRSSTNPSVIAQFDQLIMTMALSKEST